MEEASLGEAVELDIEVVEDQEGYTISGRLLEAYSGEVSIRVAPNDVGTYTVDARFAGVGLDGIGKLESEPNLILLWNENQTLSVSVTLFVTGNGIGCRGFLKEENRRKFHRKTKEKVVSNLFVFALSHPPAGLKRRSSLPR